MVEIQCLNCKAIHQTTLELPKAPHNLKIFCLSCEKESEFLELHCDYKWEDVISIKPKKKWWRFGL